LTEPRIYVTSLTDYNGGILHGEWIDMTEDIDEVWAQVEAMLESSPYANRYGEKAEEWAIHDYEGFGEIKIGESEQFSILCVIAGLIKSHGQAFATWYNDCDGSGIDLDCMEEAFREQYSGSFTSPADFAQEWADQSGFVDQIKGTVLENYIDWESYAHELDTAGFYFVRNSHDDYDVFMP